jgi:hypothetical protein
MLVMERAMKRLLCLAVTILMVVAGSATRAMSQSQPLGDYARAVKKAKAGSAKSSKTYDNDTMPDKGTVSVVGAATTEPDDKGKASTSNSQEKSDPAKEPEMKPGQSTEDRDKALGEWKQKIDDQKGKVDLLSRELDVVQRERQVNQAEFYTSPARTVQNPRGFDEEDAKYKEKIAGKQKALDDAKAKLNELQEDARKAGVPSSQRE